MTRRWESPTAHLMHYVRIDPSGCWMWTGIELAGPKGGYGMLKAEGRMWRAHRYAYRIFKGEIPDGLVLDHLCRVPMCVNPDHLEAVTHRENILRAPNTQAAINLSKTECIHGHSFTPDNTEWWRGKRSCRTCRRIRQRKVAA